MYIKFLTNRIITVDCIAHTRNILKQNGHHGSHLESEHEENRWVSCHHHNYVHINFEAYRIRLTVKRTQEISAVDEAAKRWLNHSIPTIVGETISACSWYIESDKILDIFTYGHHRLSLLRRLLSPSSFSKTKLVHRCFLCNTQITILKNIHSKLDYYK